MPVPTAIKLLQKERVLEVEFDDGQKFSLPCEYLRVFSPSAEVRDGIEAGHFIKGKASVNIIAIDPVGNYAVRLLYDDDHCTGIYSWDVLYKLGLDYQKNWQRYLERV